MHTKEGVTASYTTCRGRSDKNKLLSVADSIEKHGSNLKRLLITKKP